MQSSYRISTSRSLLGPACLVLCTGGLLAQADLLDGDRYFAEYGLNPERLALARPDAIVMHPQPMNRGIEISSEVADGARSLILDQVANGVAVRMAILYLLAGGTRAEQPQA